MYDASQDEPKIQQYLDDTKSYANSNVRVALIAAKTDLGISQAGLAIAQEHATNLNT